MLEADPKRGGEDNRECCAADPRIARYFDKWSRQQAATGNMPELSNVSRALLAMLGDIGSERPTVLELGCGSGGLTVELVRRGATEAHGVDLSADSLALARRRAEEAGVGEQTTFTSGDASHVELEPRDWVVLDRAICCYRHVEQLLANAIPAARRRFIFSVPHDRGWRGLATRIWLLGERLTIRLRGNPCPGYRHEIAGIERRLTDAGFERREQRTVGLWYAAVFERRREAKQPSV